MERLRQGQPSRPGSPLNFRGNRGPGTPHETERRRREEEEKKKSSSSRSRPGAGSSSSASPFKKPSAAGDSGKKDSSGTGAASSAPSSPTSGAAAAREATLQPNGNGAADAADSPPSSPSPKPIDPRDPKWQNSETVINFLKCMMAPTRNSVAELQRRLRNLKDDWDEFNNRMDQRMADLGTLLGRRKLMKFIKRWFEQEGTNAKIRIAVYRATLVLQKSNLRRMREVALWKWRGNATSDRLERKVEKLEATVKKQYRDLAHLQMQLLKAEDMEAGYQEAQANMIRQKLRELMMR